MRANRRDLNNLVTERLGVGPGQRVAAPGACLRAEFNDGVRREIRAGPPAVPGLAALPPDGWDLRRGWLGVWQVRRRRPGGVGRVLVQPGFEVGEPCFEIPDVCL